VKPPCFSAQNFYAEVRGGFTEVHGANSLPFSGKITYAAPRRKGGKKILTRLWVLQIISCNFAVGKFCGCAARAAGGVAGAGLALLSHSGARACRNI
jgi:hypothetical protein